MSTIYDGPPDQYFYYQRVSKEPDEFDPAASGVAAMMSAEAIHENPVGPSRAVEPTGQALAYRQDGFHSFLKRVIDVHEETKELFHSFLKEQLMCTRRPRSG
jgi:hypothetical protein